jgi:hypothetical protein
MQALMMLLRADLRYGGFPLFQDIEVYDNCGCDGQFSEALLCRLPMTYRSPDTFHTTHVYDSLETDGFCSMYVSPTHEHTKLIWVQNSIDDKLVITCPKSDRPIFLFIQGGIHCDLNVESCSQGYFGNFINFVKQQLGDCFDRVKILFSGSTVCTDEVEKKYPYQHRTVVRQYNKDMSNWFSSNYRGSQSLDFWNLTLESLNRTSDGFHQLTDVNMIKVIGILNMMNYMARNSSSLTI